MPPQDSLITLKPGQSLTLDASSDEEWKRKTRIFREIRGNILSSCFSVEFGLDRLISEIFFPGVDTPGAPAYQDEEKQGLRDLFDELFLKGNRSNFASKIHLLKSLRTKSARLDGLVDAGLIRRLDDLRDLRNRFAHYPVSFFPEQADGGQVLVARLVCRDKDLCLDNLFFDKFDSDLHSVEEDIQKVLTGLREEPSKPGVG